MRSLAILIVLCVCSQGFAQCSSGVCKAPVLRTAVVAPVKVAAAVVRPAVKVAVAPIVFVKEVQPVRSVVKKVADAQPVRTSLGIVRRTVQVPVRVVRRVSHKMRFGCH